MVPGSLGTVDQTGLYTPPSPRPGVDFTDVIDATTAGSAGCPSFTAQAAAHFGGVTPGVPTGVAISPDGSTVSWTPPGDGNTVTEYVVTVLNDPSDPAGTQTVLGTAPGTATSLAIPADRILQIEADGAVAEVTAINDQGQGRPQSPTAGPVHRPAGRLARLRGQRHRHRTTRGGQHRLQRRDRRHAPDHLSVRLLALQPAASQLHR
jgi:hypothetical protein